MLSNFLVSQGSFVAKTSPTGSGILPTGSTAQRDGSPSSGYIRFNSDDTAFEGYNGSAWSAIGGGAVSGIVGVSTFTSSGTWTKATREAALGVTIKRVIVEVQGGGGAGGSFYYDGSFYSAGSGGSGGYAKKLIDVSSISSSTITVGAAGTGALYQTGGTGGNSIWSDGTNTITCTGGSGGIYGNNANTNGGSGGTATGGDLNIDGQDGSWRAGLPGGSIYGHAGQTASFTNNSASGSVWGDAQGYGAGGRGKSTSTGPGADGAPGIVIVTEIAG